MDPKIGTYVFLQIADDRDHNKREEYKARITDVDQVSYAIEIPINEKTGQLKRLRVGDIVAAYYMSEGGIKNYFDSTVIGYSEDAIKQVIIQKPDPNHINKVQRRNYLRVPADLDVAISVKDDQLCMVCVTEDISGGGLSFFYKGSYEFVDQKELDCWLLLHYRDQSVEHVNFICNIIRVKRMDNDSQLVMVNITDIHNSDRQKIMRFCFERQLELRK